MPGARHRAAGLRSKEPEWAAFARSRAGGCRHGRREAQAARRGGVRREGDVRTHCELRAGGLRPWVRRRGGSELDDPDGGAAGGREGLEELPDEGLPVAPPHRGGREASRRPGLQPHDGGRPSRVRRRRGAGRLQREPAVAAPRRRVRRSRPGRRDPDHGPRRPERRVPAVGAQPPMGPLQPLEPVPRLLPGHGRRAGVPEEGAAASEHPDGPVLRVVLAEILHGQHREGTRTTHDHALRHPAARRHPARGGDAGLQGPGRAPVEGARDPDVVVHRRREDRQLLGAVAGVGPGRPPAPPPPLPARPRRRRCPAPARPRRAGPRGRPAAPPPRQGGPSRPRPRPPARPERSTPRSTRSRGGWRAPPAGPRRRSAGAAPHRIPAATRAAAASLPATGAAVPGRLGRGPGAPACRPAPTAPAPRAWPARAARPHRRSPSCQRSGSRSTTVQVAAPPHGCHGGAALWSPGRLQPGSPRNGRLAHAPTAPASAKPVGSHGSSPLPALRG